MMESKKCISIVPLENECVKVVECIQGLEYQYIAVENILQEKDSVRAAEVLICRDRDLTIELLEAFQQLKFIFVVSAGVEKLPFEYLKQREITVCNCGGVSDAAMSDYAIGAMLLFSSCFKKCIEYKQNRHWQRFLYTDSLKSKRLLIVGAGRIGSAIAQKASSFGMDIVGIRNRCINSPFFSRIAAMEQLDTELAEADYVVCTLPLTETTVHLFDKNRFGKMKHTAVFINISRGKIVDEKALINSLKNDCLAGAVLDVFETEPLPEDSELWDLENVVLTPHSSGRLEGFLKYAVEKFAINVKAYIQGDALPNQINLNRRY